MPLWESLLPLGRDATTGGYRRYSFTETDAACRNWFQTAARERELRVDVDRNGNLWAWWEAVGSGPGFPPGAVVTGSHLDSVPDGGAFDGPLGVVSAFAAVDLLRERGFRPTRAIGVVAFIEEEGARFGVACLGSRLLTGAIDPAAARALTDADGITLAQTMRAVGLDPDHIGRDDEVLDRMSVFVELHIEQGRQLEPRSAPVGVAESIWPHGRWRMEFSGRADHAGTSRLADRRDPMLPYAATVIAARRAAADHRALATIGKVAAEPGGVNAVCSKVRAWLDARALDEQTLNGVVADVQGAAERAAAEHGVTFGVWRESLSPAVRFDPELRKRVAVAVSASGLGEVPDLWTGAGHDAGVLAARVPTAMLFVRNPTGTSHSPTEHADIADCETGVRALAAALADLAGS